MDAAELEYRNGVKGVGVGVAGGARPAVQSLAVLNARKAIARETHTMVVQQKSNRWGVVPKAYADWWYDLRREQLRVYGALLRFIDQRLMRSESMADLREAVSGLARIPEMLAHYIADVADDVATRFRGRRAFRVWSNGTAEVVETER